MHYISIIVAAFTALTTASFNGDITYFEPGLGACGGTNGPSDLIVAVSALIYDTTQPCGKRIRVHHDGKSVDVTVVDRCAGCGEYDLDLSPAAFDRIANQAEGRVQGSWEYI